MELKSLVDQPYALLLELERRAREAMTSTGTDAGSSEEWVGIAFRLGSENFITSRTDIREVMPLPAQLTRVPGAKPWLRGVTNVRGQLLTIVDFRAFLGSGGKAPDRQGRVLVLASRDVPTGLIVDQVFGFRRFGVSDFDEQAPTPVLRCEKYLNGAYRRGAEIWPRINFFSLMEDKSFLNAGDGS